MLSESGELNVQSTRALKLRRICREALQLSLPPEKRIPCCAGKLKQGEETMTGKATRGLYTPEVKLEALRLVKAGQSIAAVAATLGVVVQTLYNWVKSDQDSERTGTTSH